MMTTSTGALDGFGFLLLAFGTFLDRPQNLRPKVKPHTRVKLETRVKKRKVRLSLDALVEL